MIKFFSDEQRAAHQIALGCATRQEMEAARAKFLCTKGNTNVVWSENGPPASFWSVIRYQWREVLKNR
jgi:hypothetical protein